MTIDCLIEQQLERIAECQSTIAAALKGRRFRVISPTFNGQPYGRSHKPVTGQEFTVGHCVFEGLRVMFAAKEQPLWVYLGCSDVEWLVQAADEKEE